MPDKTKNGGNDPTDEIKNILSDLADKEKDPELREVLDEARATLDDIKKAAADPGGFIPPEREDEPAKVLPFRKETDWNAITQQVMQGMEMMNEWYKASLVHEVEMTKAKIDGLRALANCQGLEIKVEFKL